MSILADLPIATTTSISPRRSTISTHFFSEIGIHYKHLFFSLLFSLAVFHQLILHICMKDKHVKDEKALWIFYTKDVESVSDFWHKNANAVIFIKMEKSVENFWYKRSCKRWSFFQSTMQQSDFDSNTTLWFFRNLMNATTV